MEALAAAIDSGSDAPFGPAGALIPTIRRLGDTETVAEYDSLMEGSDRPEFKLLRKARDELVEDILRRHGQDRAAATANSMGLPLLDSDVKGTGGEPNA